MGPTSSCYRVSDTVHQYVLVTISVYMRIYLSSSNRTETYSNLHLLPAGLSGVSEKKRDDNRKARGKKKDLQKKKTTNHTPTFSNNSNAQNYRTLQKQRSDIAITYQTAHAGNGFKKSLYKETDKKGEHTLNLLEAA